MQVLSLGWEDSPGGGNGNPLQYSCLDNSMEREAWRAAVHAVAKSQTWLSNCRTTKKAQWNGFHVNFVICLSDVQSKYSFNYSLPLYQASQLHEYWFVAGFFPHRHHHCKHRQNKFKLIKSFILLLSGNCKTSMLISHTLNSEQFVFLSMEQHSFQWYCFMNIFFF